jgi:alpha-1,6-mannosyl-glycoprotein beta-1,2-N-acetylglucosaminyltransferase
MPRKLPVSLSLSEIITLKNDEQQIINEDKYGPVTNDTILITIQVHNRATYLRHLINGLRNAKNIEKTLLIFSHDLYDDEINLMVQSIDFCMVLQIFYPHSIQLNPDTFPGTDKRDCPRDIEIDEARNVRCLNAEFADSYGHYREAKFTQMKHHW